MQRALHLLILLGVVLGLSGLEAASAAIPQAQAPVAAQLAMDADCMAMMERQAPAPEKAPCKGMTLACIAAMGCFVPVLNDTRAASPGVPMVSSPAAYWTRAAVLRGSNTPPEQRPPTLA